ncbi:RING-H2 finger protein ATL8-like [Malania oleifera]|uniref:RING-H2 finger protein ATL8-like n=1 Tax=Malania oleifera TaxID=397392 RepID=UPI0025AE4C73|nr:RING-H2 finger protein ATL8-like [Malania oleifera]
MTHPSRFLGGLNSSASTEFTEPGVVHSSFMLVLTAILCVLVLVIALVILVRCAWLRWNSGAGCYPPRRLAERGLKGEIFRSLPEVTYTAEHARKILDCAVCLAEFAVGDQIRVLPLCGHGFHVGCIDTWLGSHSSCPSCRQILAVAQCQAGGGVSASSAAGADESAGASEINAVFP